MIMQGIGFFALLFWAALADGFVDAFGFLPYVIGMAVIFSMILLPDMLRH